MTITAQQERPPWLSIAVLSMTALAYEILLMRLFSIIQWHHFAYMIISLALMGYGASGTFLALTRNYLLPRYNHIYIGNLVLFSLSSLVCYLASQQIQFNVEVILWDPQQAYRLIAIYVLLSLPFFFVANAIGLSLAHYRNEMTRIYAADLFGAGLGSLLIIVLLFTILPGQSLRYISALGMLAAALASWELSRHRAGLLGYLIPVFLTAMVLPFLLPHSWTEPQLSPYKGLNQTLNISGAQVVAQHSSPLGLITVVESPDIPFRHAPGLSLNNRNEPPEQVGVFIDGDAMTAITHYNGNPHTLSYLDQLTSALPYHLGHIEDVLILGAGGGADVLQARYHNIDRISAVELNKQIINLLRHDYKALAGHIYDDETVQVFAEEARGFTVRTDQHFDLIQLVLIDSFSASSAGLYALSESYLYTVEALQDYLARLNQNGYLAISRWIKLPPRDTLKLFATAIDALQRNGIQQPENYLVLIRGLQTSTLLIKHTPFSIDEISAVKDFCADRSFDVAYYPAMPAAEANRYNILARPYFYIGTTALLGDERNDFMHRYKFNLEPATDDRPFFFQFFKWRVLPEILALTGQGGMPLLEWGYLILVATLAQALLVSIFLILLPLMFYRSRIEKTTRPGLKRHVFVYFLTLGLAFLFIEIAFIQKFIQFLHHPIFAIAVVLAAFLIFAGLGSLWSSRYARPGQYDKAVQLSVFFIVLLGVSYLLLLEPIFSLLMAQATTIKIILSIALIAPLAFCMGMPFPLGLSCLGKLNPDLVPWVWGVNGCASVLSAVLATLLAIHFGFSAVILSALALYTVTAINSTNWLR